MTNKTVPRELAEFRAVAAMVMLKCGPTVRHWNDEHTTVPHPLTALVEMASMALDRWPEDAPQPTLAAPLSDDDLLRLVYKHFGRGATNSHHLLRTVWKDSIDIEEPTFALLEFAKELTADAYRQGAEAMREAAAMPRVHPMTRESALHDALRKLAIYSDGKECDLCAATWEEQGREYHVPGCLAAPTVNDGLRESPAASQATDAIPSTLTQARVAPDAAETGFSPCVKMTIGPFAWIDKSAEQGDAVALLRRDAERYRWLRKQDNWTPFAYGVGDEEAFSRWEPSELDAQIDAYLDALPEKE